MIYTDFSMEKDGFVGHMVEPESGNTGHIVIAAHNSATGDN